MCITTFKCITYAVKQQVTNPHSQRWRSYPQHTCVLTATYSFHINSLLQTKVYREKIYISVYIYTRIFSIHQGVNYIAVEMANPCRPLLTATRTTTETNRPCSQAELYRPARHRTGEVTKQKMKHGHMKTLLQHPVCVQSSQLLTHSAWPTDPNMPPSVSLLVCGRWLWWVLCQDCGTAFSSLVPLSVGNSEATAGRSLKGRDTADVQRCIVWTSCLAVCHLH